MSTAPQWPQKIPAPDMPLDEYEPPDSPHLMDAESIVWLSTLPRDTDNEELFEARERARDFLGRSLTPQSADIMAEIRTAHRRRERREEVRIGATERQRKSRKKKDAKRGKKRRGYRKRKRR